jgi:UDP-N-acetylglucosamine 4,6-dehydratase
MTNMMGGRNVVEAALDTSVEKVMALSTDKAVNPINLYGATKLAAEKLFIQSNAYAGGRDVRFSCVRYGNVVGSRGSVVPMFIKQRETGRITVTDKRMTRFWLSLDQGVDFTIRCIEQMQGGEVFVPKIPSMRKVLISEDEARHTLELKDMFVVEPTGALWFGHDWRSKGNLLEEGFCYASDNNNEWLDESQIQEIVQPFEAVH